MQEINSDPRIWAGTLLGPLIFVGWLNHRRKR